MEFGLKMGSIFADENIINILDKVRKMFSLGIWKLAESYPDKLIALLMQIKEFNATKDIDALKKIVKDIDGVEVNKLKVKYFNITTKLRMKIRKYIIIGLDIIVIGIICRNLIINKADSIVWMSIILALPGFIDWMNKIIHKTYKS